MKFCGKVHYFDNENNQEILQVDCDDICHLPRKGELIWFKFANKEETELYVIEDVEHIIDMKMTNVGIHTINIHMDKGDK